MECRKTRRNGKLEETNRTLKESTNRNRLCELDTSTASKKTKFVPLKFHGEGRTRLTECRFDSSSDDDSEITIEPECVLRRASDKQCPESVPNRLDENVVQTEKNSDQERSSLEFSVLGKVMDVNTPDFNESRHYNSRNDDHHQEISSEDNSSPQRLLVVRTDHLEDGNKSDLIENGEKPCEDQTALVLETSNECTSIRNLLPIPEVSYLTDYDEDTSMVWFRKGILENSDNYSRDPFAANSLHKEKEHHLQKKCHFYSTLTMTQINSTQNFDILAPNTPESEYGMSYRQRQLQNYSRRVKINHDKQTGR